MFRKIMVPVDLAHVDALSRAFDVAAGLARQYEAALHYVGVGTSAPQEGAHNPQELRGKLEAFAAEQGERHGLETTSGAVQSHDPAIDLDNRLLDHASEIGADLIVMGTHVPGFRDHFFTSHGGQVASAATISVFLVR